ncbi:head GIN domain-containing protein [Flavobacterium sp. DGU11]|uniref:Head GIN domain-containing protein n=1 Tax=Flavobacterium arundinis TaxID=3139143 RepID=A0ABU9HUS5_9FLAO
MIKVITHVAKAIVAVAAALLFFSCGIDVNFKQMDGSGNVVTKERKLTGDYKAISVARGLEVVIEQGSNYAVIVEADDNLQDHITTEVSNGELKISADVNIRNATSKKVIVKLPHIESIEASSGSSITSRNTLKSESIDLSSGSGSSLDVTIEAKDSSCESGSGSTLTLAGKVDNLQTESSSGSSLNARKLTAKKVIAEASSGSTSTVNAVESLSAQASSGASINYVSTPANLTKKASSGGSVGQE